MTRNEVYTFRMKVSKVKQVDHQEGGCIYRAKEYSKKEGGLLPVSNGLAEILEQETISSFVVSNSKYPIEVYFAIKQKKPSLVRELSKRIYRGFIRQSGR
jgi:hypothetical protein